MKQSIVVAGSSNTDMVIKTDHIPVPGETVLGGVFFMNPGGKGANQAVSAARLGGNVIFIGKTGNDLFGQQTLKQLKEEGIQTTFLRTDSLYPSGVALITVDNHGENCIVVAPGANAALRAEDLVEAKQTIEQSAIVLVQLEIPLDTVDCIISMAANKAMVILNPAPASKLPDALFRKINIITPNRKEAEMLTGIVVTNISTAEQAAHRLRDKGVETVILTLGPEGALILHEGIVTHISAVPVQAIDTTAAGDVFNGALAVALAEGKTIKEAAHFACRAAALSVTRLGAQASAPYRSELDRVSSDI